MIHEGVPCAMQRVQIGCVRQQSRVMHADPHGIGACKRAMASDECACHSYAYRSEKNDDTSEMTSASAAHAKNSDDKQHCQCQHASGEPGS